jgi:hypothetical protein
MAHHYITWGLRFLHFLVWFVAVDSTKIEFREYLFKWRPTSSLNIGLFTHWCIAILLCRLQSINGASLYYLATPVFKFSGVLCRQWLHKNRISEISFQMASQLLLEHRLRPFLPIDALRYYCKFLSINGASLYYLGTPVFTFSGVVCRRRFHKNRISWISFQMASQL